MTGNVVILGRGPMKSGELAAGHPGKGIIRLQMTEETKVIRHCLSVAREKGYSGLALRHGSLEFSARLSGSGRPEVHPQSVRPKIDEGLPDPGLVPIVSPVVGYYRESSEPLAVGIQVEKGSVVALVAALGLANDVESPVRGEVVEVMVESNQPVEYGQRLAMVRAS